MVFRDEAGRELFDLPTPETPAPVRILGEWDNMLLSYADRTRVLPEAYRPRIFTVNGQVYATVLIDGFVAGDWKVDWNATSADLVIRRFSAVSDEVRTALVEEGERLRRFAAAEAERRSIRFTAG